jgi:hypothetical protein
MTEIKTGDPVRILTHHRRYDSFPADGYEGTVTKVARKYATATYVRQSTAYPAGPVTETVEFDIKTGSVRPGTDHGINYGLYVRTAERYEREQRQSASLALLKEAGFEVRLGRHPDGELIERLAAAVLDWTAEQTGRDPLAAKDGDPR